MSGSRIEDYASAITAAMKIVSLMDEIDGLKGKIRSLLTYEELIDGKYKNEFIGASFEKAEVGLEPATYVKSKCVLGGVSVCLHEPIDNLSSRAMAMVINEARPTK